MTQYPPDDALSLAAEFRRRRPLRNRRLLRPQRRALDAREPVIDPAKESRRQAFARRRQQRIAAMSKCYQLTDGQIIVLAEELTNEQRIKIIERFATLGTEQKWLPYPTRATTMENGHFSSIETVDWKRPKSSDFGTPLDLLGKRHRWSVTGGLDRATWVKILWHEVCA
jgi:hypothetical protein